ncbi:TPA: phosphopantetheine-binding protein [Streptococcus pneumoniae]|jgi:phosphopantetheine attachment domain protein|uniref:phosphopantetheine-binding protein n=1 Tax=Streptococcus mitis TaxID=28037 RepID=UPI0021BAD705|nr:phosphopantetheine-binding protein [Streptococcus mitis]
MRINEIKKNLISILNENFSKDIDDNIDNIKLLDEGIGLDSLQIIEYIMYIEDYFAIMIPDSELDPEKFYDIVALARFIESIMEN